MYTFIYTYRIIIAPVSLESCMSQEAVERAVGDMIAAEKARSEELKNDKNKFEIVVLDSDEEGDGVDRKLPCPCLTVDNQLGVPNLFNCQCNWAAKGAREVTPPIAEEPGTEESKGTNGTEEVTPPIAEEPGTEESKGTNGTEEVDPPSAEEPERTEEKENSNEEEEVDRSRNENGKEVKRRKSVRRTPRIHPRNAVLGDDGLVHVGKKLKLRAAFVKFPLPEIERTFEGATDEEVEEEKVAAEAKAPVACLDLSII